MKKKATIAMLVLMIFVISLISPIFAEDNSSSSNVVTQTVNSATYQTTSASTYDSAYSQNTTTSSSTYSTTYSGGTNVIIPPISDDNLKIKEAEKLNNDQKQNIRNLIKNINQLRTRFNRLNADVNGLKAKLNRYYQAIKNNDKALIDSELQKIITSANQLVSKIQKELKSKSLNPNDLATYNQQLNDLIAQIKAYQEKYQKEKAATVEQVVYQIKNLIDSNQIAIKDNFNQISSINEQIKAKSKDYEQARNANDYNKMVSLLNDLIGLYQQKVDKITAIKNIYTNLLSQVNTILENSALKFIPSLKLQNNKLDKNQEREKEKEKNKNINKNGNKNVEIDLNIKVPKGAHIKINRR